MNTPREAIVVDITRAAVAPSPTLSPTPGGRSQDGSKRWAGTSYRGGHPYQARPETIRFLKERVEGDRALLAVEFEGVDNTKWRYVFGASRRAGADWSADGGAGGGGGTEPQVHEPWANFGGWGWPRFLCLGGRVHGEGVVRVRLTDADGRVVEDDVANGVALLLSNQPVQMPCRMELLDLEGQVLRTQAWPPEPGSRPR
jgi:hypothetical protein